MSYVRTPAHRAAQAAAIRRWRPWEASTGPKTEQGKRRVAANPDKGRQRDKLRAIARALREHRRTLNSLVVIS
jgi:hypothetical protein